MLALFSIFDLRPVATGVGPGSDLDGNVLISEDGAFHFLSEDGLSFISF